jgi:hypothetical protein
MGRTEEASPEPILARMLGERDRLPIEEFLQTHPGTDDLLPCKIFMLCASLAYKLDLHLYDADQLGEPPVSMLKFSSRWPEFADILTELEGPVYLVIHNHRVGWAKDGLSLALILFFCAADFFFRFLLKKKD